MSRPEAKPGAFSAGVVVVRQEPDGWRFLLLRAWRNWDFPKGAVEAGETPLAAAVRETAEEAGLRDLDFRWGEDYVETGPYGPRRKISRYYLAQTATRDIHLPVSPELGHPEHHEWRWVTLEEARRLVSPRLLPVLQWAARHVEESSR
ncbi:bis(5'-nucleosyl)-tetraphosphatase [Thiobacter aerophilum]|uniref:Bis(5'-nucleosyl)-tetraphosphatase [asymmetrical] n=1 Tax=Thiobacter aerophilum TaxID=3121275 RepID=A0ABV0ED53_9BURK